MKVNEWQIESYQEQDVRMVEALLKFCLEEDRIKLLTNRKFAFTAKLEGEVVGFIVGRENKFHPYCTYITLVIHPAYHDQNIESGLLHAVDQLVLEYPLQTSIWETVQYLREFYETSGFTEIRRTYMPELDLQRVESFKGNYEKRCGQNEQVRIKTLKEIWDNADSYELSKLVEMVKSVYEETHQANPLGIHDAETWDQLVHAEDIIAEASYVAFHPDNDTIQGYAFLHGTSSTSVELGWRGTIHNIELINHLTWLQIKYALAKGVQIHAEIDTTDRYHMEVLKSFPFKPAPTLITYQLNK